MGRANTFTNTRSEVIDEPLAKWANSNLPTPGVTSTRLEEAPAPAPLTARTWKT